jgi:hypothetical protein
MLIHLGRDRDWPTSLVSKVYTSRVEQGIGSVTMTDNKIIYDDSIKTTPDAIRGLLQVYNRDYEDEFINPLFRVVMETIKDDPKTVFILQGICKDKPEIIPPGNDTPRDCKVADPADKDNPIYLSFNSKLSEPFPFGEIHVTPGIELSRVRIVCLWPELEWAAGYFLTLAGFLHLPGADDQQETVQAPSVTAEPAKTEQEPQGQPPANEVIYVPKRRKEHENWKSIWRIIGNQVCENGENPADAIKTLNRRSYKGLIPLEETMSSIIKAGKAGLLS